MVQLIPIGTPDQCHILLISAPTPINTITASSFELTSQRLLPPQRISTSESSRANCDAGIRNDAYLIGNTRNAIGEGRKIGSTKDKSHQVKANFRISAFGFSRLALMSRRVALGSAIASARGSLSYAGILFGGEDTRLEKRNSNAVRNYHVRHILRDCAAIGQANECRYARHGHRGGNNVKFYYVGADRKYLEIGKAEHSKSAVQDDHNTRFRKCIGDEWKKNKKLPIRSL
ncbi:hypothetical protein KM043_014200 [Ampulex compressa]|nr:hypothetical protein KM043_014200 [Ampulex compressa]